LFKKNARKKRIVNFEIIFRVTGGKKVEEEGERNRVRWLQGGNKRGGLSLHGRM